MMLWMDLPELAQEVVILEVVDKSKFVGGFPESV